MRPGQAFALIANGQRVMVTCPANARPGQKIRFQLPIKLSSDEIQSIKLNYQKDGWIRCLSTDLTFHWVRSEGDADSEQEAKKKLEWAFEQTDTILLACPWCLTFERQIKNQSTKQQA